jgi:hypothetical protein
LRCHTYVIIAFNKNVLDLKFKPQLQSGQKCCAHEGSSAAWPGGGRRFSSRMDGGPSLRRLREAERTIRPSPEGTGPPPSATTIFRHSMSDNLSHNFFKEEFYFFSRGGWQRRRRWAGPPSLAGPPPPGGLTGPPAGQPRGATWLQPRGAEADPSPMCPPLRGVLTVGEGPRQKP